MRILLLARATRALDPGPAALPTLATSLERLGASVTLDVGPAPRGDERTAVLDLADALEKSWIEDAPDVVHAHGRLAASAALAASRGRLSVVVTPDDSAGPVSGEKDTVHEADAVVVRGSAAREGWLAAGLPKERVHVVPLPVEVTHAVPARRPEPGLVVTDARGRDLERITSSLRWWPETARLLVIRPSGRTPVRPGADADGVGEGRVRLVAAGEVPWADVDLVVAGGHGAGHAALVVEAAAQGVPAVAPDLGAFADVVVDGGTGLLLPAGATVEAIGVAVGSLLVDPLRVRGYGLAARLRARAAHDPGRVAERCLSVYTAVLAARLAREIDDDPLAGRRATTAPRGTAGGAEQWHDLVIEHMAVARRLAQRYAGRGQSVDDLVQVANLGLVKAAQRFEPDQGTPFVAYAVPTMLGELRRFFRDNAWAIHVPRSVQETALRVRQSNDRLRQSLGHEVEASEIATDLGLSLGDVLEASKASGVAFACRSLDAALLDESDSRLSEILGCDDAALDLIEARESLRKAFTRLPPREREILVLRFFGELTQSEIAEQLGISQMHVSRLLARTLGTLREHVVDDLPLPSAW